MLKSRFLLSLVAFAVSFCISLLTGRDLGRALFTGLTTLFASLVGVAVSERRYRHLFEKRAAELMAHIRGLQRRRTDTYDSLVALTAEHDRITTSLNSLQTQLRNLQIQSSNLWQQKEELSWNLATPQLGVQAPVNQIQSLKNRIQQLETQEAELNRSLAATLTAKQRADLSLTTAQAELNQLQAQVLEQRNLKEQLIQEITKLTAQKQQIDADLTVLQPQVHELERYRSELNQFLRSAEPKRQQVETGSKSLQASIEQLQLQISSLHVELSQLESQILDRRTQKEALDQELSVIKGELAKKVSKPKSKDTDQKRGSYLQTDSALLSASVSPEWTQLITQLSPAQFEALRAIVEDANPNPKLKKIAEEHLTMPELLIDAINEQALTTIGDLIIDPGVGTAAPTVAQEYLKTVQTLIIAYLASH